MPTRNATERTHSPDGSKTISQLNREHQAVLDAEPSVARCARPGCEDWRADGTAAEMRSAYAEHMAVAHPDRLKVETTPQRRKRERAEAEQAAAARAAEYSDDGRASLAAMDAGEPQRPPEPKRRMRWTRELALERIRAYAAEHGHPPSTTDFRSEPALPTPTVVTRLFGTDDRAYGGLSNAVAAAGFPRPSKGTDYGRHRRPGAVPSEPSTRRPGRQPSWDEERVIEAIRAFVHAKGFVPAASDFDDRGTGLPSRTVLKRLYQTAAVAPAVRAAGLEPPTSTRRREPEAVEPPPRPLVAVSAPARPSPVSPAVRPDPVPEKPVERVEPRAPADIEELALRFEAMAGVLRALDDLGDSLGAEQRRSLTDACLRALEEFTRGVFAPPTEGGSPCST